MIPTRKMRRIAVPLLAAALATPGAANAETATASSKAKVFSNVTVTNSSDLNFGTIVTAASPSVVDISTTGARTCGAGLSCLGATSAADFTIGGSSGQVTTISVSNSVTITSGTDTMLALLNPTSALVTLVSNSGAFSIGGTLLVGGAQAEGTYTGSFTATVNYQ
jgi:Mat/Ecp fimbriae major subunit